jgi:hypothetical protein
MRKGSDYCCCFKPQTILDATTNGCGKENRENKNKNKNETKRSIFRDKITKNV